MPNPDANKTRIAGSPIKFEEPTLNFKATNMVARALRIFIADTKHELRDTGGIMPEDVEADMLNDLGYCEAMLADFERRITDVTK